MAETKKPAIRIAKLPDLTPIKMSISVELEVHRMLEDYAKIYSETYRETVKPAALVHLMIAAFLATNNDFKRARKAL